MPIAEIQIKGLSKIAKNFADAPVTIARNLQKAVGEAAFKVTEIAKREAPAKTRILRRSIRPRIGVLEAVVSPNVVYAKWVHDGTNPYEIRPKRKKALFWKGALHPVRRVRHPGIKANPFMERAADGSRQDVEKIFQKYVDQSVTALVKK